jgi:hypothetical protein
MPSLSLRRNLLALTLAALVGLPSVTLAAPRGQAPEAARAAQVGLSSQFWSFLQNLWGAAGMLIDPNGRATATTPRGLAHVSGAAGMLIDPDGRMAAPPHQGPTHVSGDAGMLIDPDGQH